MISVFKLTTGEDVISEFQDYDHESVVLTNPMLLAVSEKGIHMMPYALFAEKQEIVVSKPHIMFSYKPSTQLEDGYRQQTGGVVRASSSVLEQIGE